MTFSKKCNLSTFSTGNTIYSGYRNVSYLAIKFIEWILSLVDLQIIDVFQNSQTQWSPLEFQLNFYFQLIAC